jgi:uncharacterized membrane protein
VACQKQKRILVEIGIGILAWIVAFVGIALLAVERWRVSGAMITLAAAVIAILASRDWHAIEFTPPRASTSGAWSLRIILGLIGIAAALLIGLVGALIYLGHPKETFGVAGWLWMLSIAILIGSVFSLDGPIVVSDSSGWIAPVETSSKESALPWPGWEKAALGGVVVLAVALRVWNLHAFPENVYLDEIMTGHISSESYIGPGTGPSIFSIVWGGIDLPALWFLAVSKSLKIFGQTLAAVRLPSALFGAATVLPFYGLLRMIWGRSAAIAGSIIMAFSASNIHYSRLGISNILTPFFWTLCFFFLVRALRFHRLSDWTLAGIVAGLSEYGFYATRLLPILLFAFGFYLLVVHRREIRTYALGFGCLGVGYVVGFGPLLVHFLAHRGLYFRHGASLMVWNHIPSSLNEFWQMCGALWPTFARNLLGLSTIPSQDIIYFAPLLLPAEAALLVLGTGLMIRDWKHPASFLMLLTGLGVIFVGGTLVKGSPFINHLTAAFPAVCAAIAIPIAASIDGVSKLLTPTSKWMASAILVVVLLVLGVLNVRFYFNYYYANPDVVEDPRYRSAQRVYEIQTALARYLGGLGPDYVVRTVANNSVPYDFELMKYLSATQEYANISEPVKCLPLQTLPKKVVVFIFFPGKEQYQSTIRSCYPGGATSEVHSKGGRHLFYVYMIPPQL